VFGLPISESAELAILFCTMSLSTYGWTDTWAERFTSAADCGFADCDRESEAGWAARAVIEGGDLDANCPADYHKLNKVPAYSQRKPYARPAISRRNAGRLSGRCTGAGSRAGTDR
jgi:hypothetical protein